MDDDGFLYLMARKMGMIISGGVNIHPKDIEEIIVHHPAVREGVVFGLPSEKWCEIPISAVTLRKSGAAPPEELKAWINENVGPSFSGYRTC